MNAAGLPAGGRGHGSHLPRCLPVVTPDLRPPHHPPPTRYVRPTFGPLPLCCHAPTPAYHYRAYATRTPLLFVVGCWQLFIPTTVEHTAALLRFCAMLFSGTISVTSALGRAATPLVPGLVLDGYTDPTTLFRYLPRTAR